MRTPDKARRAADKNAIMYHGASLLPAPGDTVVSDSCVRRLGRSVCCSAPGRASWDKNAIIDHDVAARLTCTNR